VTWLWLLWLLPAAAVTYWLLVVTEGAYLGKRAVIALYDWGASSYDRVKNVRPFDDEEHLARPLLGPLQRVRHPLVLDVATGTGRLPLSLLRQWAFQGRVVGIDLSRRMLAIAQRRTFARRQRAGWVRQDAMSLPFHDDCFQAVACVEALEFLPRPSDVLAEMVRVLCPGGQLLLSNRVGIDARFFPGRALSSRVLATNLAELGLVSVRPRRWQVHYDLIQAQKPTRTAANCSTPRHREPTRSRTMAH